MDNQIDVSGYDMRETLEKELRRQAELCQSKGLTRTEASLLPLSIALSRLSARMAHAEAN